MSLENKPSKTEIPIAQFIAVIVLSISVFLIIDFGRRAATGYRIHREEQKLEAQLNALQETNQTLEERLNYAETDAYVVEVARNELKWSTPGETVIVILATPETPPTPSITSQRTLLVSSQPDTPFNAWLKLFFPEMTR